MFLKISLLLLTQHLTSSKCELIRDPSLKPFEKFSDSHDAGILKKELRDDACTDRDKIADILFHRTLDQRMRIKHYYNNNDWGYYNKYGNKVEFSNLANDVLGISKGSLNKLYHVIFETFDGQLGRTLQKAIAGEWKEAGVIEEIVCANEKEMKDLIDEYFVRFHQSNVEEHLKSVYKDNPAFQEAIRKYCWTPRCQDKKIKPEDVDKEVKSLQNIDPKNDYKEGFKKKLKELLDKYCEPDLKEIFNKYKINDHRISDGVDEAFDGSAEKTAFNVLVRYIENTCMYYADELYHAVDGCGTDIDKINRIVLTRSERDMGCIFKEYKNKRGETFTQRLKRDTSEFRYLECIRDLCGKT